MKQEELCNSIIDTYLSKDNFSKLSWMQQQHFLNRLKLIPGYEGVMTKELQKSFCSKLLTRIDNITKCIQGKQDLEYGYKKYVLDQYDSKINDRQQHIYDFLNSSYISKSHKKTLLLGSLSESISILYHTDKDKVTKDLVKIYNLIEPEYFNVISNTSFIVSDDNYRFLDKSACPTTIINLLYYTRFIYEHILHDKETVMTFNKYISMAINRVVDNYWHIQFSSHLQDHSYIENIVYALTHVIIGESEFYTKTITDNSLMMVTSIIKKWLESAYKKTPDLLCEGALSLKVYNKAFYYNQYQKVSDTLLRQAERSHSKILYNYKENEGVVEKNEHINILYILLNKL